MTGLQDGWIQKPRSTCLRRRQTCGVFTVQARGHAGLLPAVAASRGFSLFSIHGASYPKHCITSRHQYQHLWVECYF